MSSFRLFAVDSGPPVEVTTSMWFVAFDAAARRMPNAVTWVTTSSSMRELTRRSGPTSRGVSTWPFVSGRGFQLRQIRAAQPRGTI